MNRLSLRNNWLKFKTSGKLPIISRGIYEIRLKLVKKNGKLTTCNRLGFGNTRISTNYAQKSPRTLFRREGELTKAEEIDSLVCPKVCPGNKTPSLHNLQYSEFCSAIT